MIEITAITQPLWFPIRSVPCSATDVNAVSSAWFLRYDRSCRVGWQPKLCFAELSPHRPSRRVERDSQSFQRDFSLPFPVRFSLNCITCFIGWYV